MALLKICSKCGKKYDYYGHCECYDKNNKINYKEYKRNRTDTREQSFYSSSAWIKCRDTIRMHYNDMCLCCYIEKGTVVEEDTIHHIIELKEDWTERLNDSNLIPLCNSCHKKVHKLYELDCNTKIATQVKLRKLKDTFEKEFN